MLCEGYFGPSHDPAQILFDMHIAIHSVHCMLYVKYFIFSTCTYKSLIALFAIIMYTGVNKKRLIENVA